MQRYKSLFSEAKGSTIASERDAKTKVDVSKLTWKSGSRSNWETAIKKAPKGYRLPTIQELYSAYYNGLDGFKDTTYWSSSQPPLNDEDEGAWCIDFNRGDLTLETITITDISVMYVKVGK